MVLTMAATLLLTILGVSAGAQHCPRWKEIAPCNCRLDTSKVTTIACEKMGSYGQVVDVLQDHFQPTDRVSLRVASSDLRDLDRRRFKELNMSIENLKLNHDHVGSLEPESFEGLTKVTYLSLADSVLEEVPELLWKKMPNIKTLDLGRTKIKYISDTSFVDLPYLECLVLPGNQITRMDTHSMPSRLQKVHLGRNYIRDLNNTLRNLSALGWLFINSNDLTNLEGELPVEAPDLQLIHASHNRIEKLPQQLKNYPLLESLFFQYNRLRSLDTVFSDMRHLIRVVLEHNEINTITEDDFVQTEMLESLLLGHNQLTTLNNSVMNLRNLNFLNLTFNYLTEFSFQDVVGLQELRSIDLSFNQISLLIGPAALFQNLVEWNIKLTELKLDHNELETLNGALAGLPKLLRLNLSFNKLKKISPDDLIGLDELRLLDISHNRLTTLEETSKTFLPRLSELRASYNYLTILERDFHGLPVLCLADLSNNQIVALGRDLVSKTRCKIEHGVHEGTWDTLKIYLQDNPILCDAALPEITSAMEINHTKISGVSQCPPLSEQPTTSKPNGFLGYIPETTPALPAAISAGHTSPEVQIQTVPLAKPSPIDSNNNLQYAEKIREPAVELRTHDHYTIENDQPLANGQVRVQKPIALTLQKPNEEPRQGSVGTSEVNGDSQRSQASANVNQAGTSVKPSTNAGVEPNARPFDPVLQGQQINKLASQIEELRTRIDQLTSQNQLLLNQQHDTGNRTDPTTRPPNDNLTELRKP